MGPVHDRIAIVRAAPCHAARPQFQNKRRVASDALIPRFCGVQLSVLATVDGLTTRPLGESGAHSEDEPLRNLVTGI